MRRGYVNLVEDGFFGEATDYTTEDFKDVKLIDKINLKAKLGIAIEVPFNDEEQVFMDRAMTTQTFEEVVELARDILIYTQDNQEELLTPPPELPEGMEYQDESGESQEGPQGHDDYEMPDSQGEVERKLKLVKHQQTKIVMMNHPKKRKVKIPVQVTVKKKRKLI